MQIHSITRFIAAPFLFAIGYVLYQIGSSYEFRDAYGWVIFPLLIILVALYVFSPNIDFWYHKKYPIKLDASMINWLNTHFVFYQNLSDTDKDTFRNRMSLFMEAKEFYLMKREKETMPEEMKTIITAHAIWVSFGQDDYLLPSFDRIVAYTHPFPTPFYKHLHTIEVEENDGVLLFSFDHVINGLHHIEKYNVALHGFAEAYLKEWKISDRKIAKIDDQLLEITSNIKLQSVLDTIGFDRTDSTLVASHHYFKFFDGLKNKAPEIFQNINDIFKLKTIHDRS
jgi:hypothetical protein